MNSGTKKLILPLDHVQSAVHPVPLRGIYALPAPGSKARSSDVHLSVLPPVQSFLALVKNTFNDRIVNQARLERQFEAASGVAGLMPVKQVSYPRGLSRIAAVRDALMADLESAGDQQGACGD